jgi:hypothetical protein
MKKTAYSYCIIKENYPELARETTLLESKYKKTKFAFIEKICHADGSENISRIVYSNDLQKLQSSANGYFSWYNYPLNLTKNIQQFISHINK